MPRNLVLCFDGTNNQFGSQNTSVVRLVQLLDRDPAAQQRLYYDPGVGTLPEPGVWGALAKRLSEVLGLAFGAGLTGKMERAYTYLMNFWEPGDHVFLFGFSRGAYTARVLAGMLHGLGLLPRGNDNLVPYVTRLFRSVRGRGDQAEHWRVCDEFRRTFARVALGGGEQRRFPVHFMGLWDTVSSVGWVWDPASFPFTACNPSVSIVRHAVSMDERRCFYRQNLIRPAAGQDLQERWFPGVHSDVGGGYPEKDGGLWRCSFDWILAEAKASGLKTDAAREDAVLAGAPARTWAEPQHESLHGLWWGAEYFPKLVWDPATHHRWPQFGRGRARHVPDGALIDRSTLLRTRDVNDYKPRNVPRSFLTKLRNLSTVPDALPFEGAKETQGTGHPLGQAQTQDVCSSVAKQESLP